MTKKMVVVLEVGVGVFFLFFFMDDLVLNDMTLIFGVDINSSMSIETRT